MRTQHHDFVFLVFIGARNFGDGVVLHGIVVVESVGDVQFKGHVFLLLQQAGDARPVLERQVELRNGCGFAGSVAPTGLHKHGSSAGGLAAVVDNRKNFFIGQELV